MNSSLLSMILLAAPLAFVLGCSETPKVISPVDENGQIVKISPPIDYSERKNFISEVHILESAYPDIYNDLVNKVNKALNYKTVTPTTTAATRKFVVNVYDPVLKYCINEGQVIGDYIKQKGIPFYKLVETPELDKCISQRLKMPVEFSNLAALKGSYQYELFANEPAPRALLNTFKIDKKMTQADLLKVYHEFAVHYDKQEKSTTKDIIDSL